MFVLEGLDIQKIDKFPLMYCVSYFNLGALELCSVGLSPPKPSVAMGLSNRHAKALNSRRK